jgi:heme/copper-type cytochrome/quinol oxidase subunit 2
MPEPRPQPVQVRRARTTFIALAAVAASLALLAGGEAAAQGCAMCKTAIGGPGDPLARGINTSIFFMMAMPFALFAVVGGWLGYVFWRGRERENDDAAIAEQARLELMYTEREGAR